MGTDRENQAATEIAPGSGALGGAVHPYAHVARRPNVKPYFKLGPTGAAARVAEGAGPWNVPDLCRAYDWPIGLAGGGVIAIVELGGGWVQSDMDQFFGAIGQPVSQITDVSIDGTQNIPDPEPFGVDAGVALDIEVAGAAYFVATGEPATIRVYWAQDIASAVRAATADNCDVCAISWGADEANWGIQAGRDMEQAAVEAAAAGMIVLAASGDNDSSDGGPGPANVDLPGPNSDTGGEFSGSAATSAAVFVRQAESTRESRFAELSAHEQATNSEFATSVNSRVTSRQIGHPMQSRSASLPEPFETPACAPAL